MGKTVDNNMIRMIRKMDGNIGFEGGAGIPLSVGPDLMVKASRVLFFN